MRKRSCLATLFLALWLSLSSVALSADKLQIAFPSLTPGPAPSWVTAEKRIWEKYGLEVELIYVRGGVRGTLALVGGSVQILLASDVAVTQAIAQGIDLVKLGVTTNSLGSSLVTQRDIQSLQDLKGKVVGVSLGRDNDYPRLVKLLRDHGINPSNDVKFLPIGEGQLGRLAALQAGTIQGTILSPPLNFVASREGLKILEKIEIPTIAGGVNTTAAFARQNRKTLASFLSGYMDGIHYMVTHKEESLKVFAKYLKNPDMAVMANLYDDVTSRVERGLWPNPGSVRYLIDLVAVDEPKAKRLTERDHWDLSLIEEIRQSGFLERLYKK